MGGGVVNKTSAGSEPLSDGSGRQTREPSVHVGSQLGSSVNFIVIH